MALDYNDLKEQVTSQLKNSWEQFQESSLYNKLRDKYENLSVTGQKIALFGVLFVIVLMLFSFPWGFYSGSSDFVSEFETKRGLIRDLLKVSREANDTPDIPIPPDATELKGRIESILQQAQLTPEQLKGIDSVSSKSNLIPASLSNGMVKVNLAKLTLRQIVDLGYKLQSQSASIKMKDIFIEANSQLPNYFDVIYNLIILKVPELPPVIAEPEEAKSKS